jgi:hypothetical protein
MDNLWDYRKSFEEIDEQLKHDDDAIELGT